VSRSWPTSSRNDAASRSSMKHMAGSPPCRGSMPGRLEHCPDLQPHRHEFFDGSCGRRAGLGNGLRVRRAPTHFLENPMDRLAGQLLGQVGEQPWARRPRPGHRHLSGLRVRQ
jgi:hypothetical protein